MSSRSCPLCGSFSVAVFDKYRYNHVFDREYLPCSQLLRCDSCDLGFAYPLPSEAQLSSYYSTIYRRKGRPYLNHCASSFKIDLRYISLAFDIISTFVSRNPDYTQKLRVLDFGAGNGELGIAMLSIYDNIELFAIEPDSASSRRLENIGYKVYDNLSLLPELDILVSNHSLEHLLAPFPELHELTTKKMSSRSMVCIEVPYCSMDQDFMSRVYDSPHLTFWNRKSLSKLFAKLDISIDRLYNYGAPYAAYFSHHIRPSTPREHLRSLLKCLWSFSFLKRLIHWRIRSSLYIILERSMYAPVHDSAFRISNSSDVPLNCIRVLGFKD